MAYNTLNQNRFLIEFQNINTNYYWVNSNDIVDYNKFYYVTSVFDWNKIKIFVNWILNNEIQSDLSILSNSEPIRIWWWVANRYTNWIIDDVKIYNRALSDSEILQQAKIAGF